MSSNLDLSQQLELVTEVLEQTRGGKLTWDRGLLDNSYVGATRRAAAVLDQSGPPRDRRVRLRFSQPGSLDFTDTIEQTFGTLYEEERVDAQLALLWQIVTARLAPPESDAQRFYEDLRGET